MARWLRWVVGTVGAIAAALAILVVAGIADTDWPGAPPETTGRALPGQTEYEGRTRTWITYVPERLEEPAAAVLALHGSGQTAQALRETTHFRFEQLADRDGFLVVYPEGWAEGGAAGPEWNECRKNTLLPAHLENVDDVGFILWVLERVMREHPLDATRVYAMGLSDGGQMAYRLATEHPERFAAIAAVIAQQAAPENSNCTQPRGPVSVLVMNGTADPIIPYGGGEASFYGWFSAGQVQSIEGTVEHWKRVNGIDAPGTREELPDLDPDDGSTVVRERWRGDAGREVVLYSIVGGGHTLPGGFLGAPAFLVGPTNRDISGVDEIWGFFRAHQ